MRQSTLFTKTRREAPKDEVSKNAALLIRGGYIHKEMAGVYTILPLGLRTLGNITAIIREEMNGLGAEEVLLTALQNPELWKKTDRWKQDVWFKTSLASGGEVGLGWTQEEAVTHMASGYVTSYRDLPAAVYQIQTKFRNEERAKSGILRGREFLMKDLYSFHATEADLDIFYEKAQNAYKNVFDRVGIGEHTYRTFASGGAFAKYSHEYQTLSDAGEDTVYVSKEKNIAINKEVFTDEVLSDLGVARDELEERSAIEVGNIFKLGTRFSSALNLSFKDENGEDKPVIMGCYGIGPTRLLGTVVETLSDDRGIVWPKSIAPFRIHLIELSQGNAGVKEAADELYEELTKQGVAVLYDDRDLRAGEKFGDADLLGMPYRAVVSEKTMAEGKIELTERATGKTRMVDEAALYKI